MVLFGDAGFVRPFLSGRAAATIVVVPEPSPTIFLRDLGESPTGLVLVSPCDLGRADPQVESFKRAFREAHGISPDEIAAFAYDGSRLLLAALREAGPNRARIRDAIAATDSVKGVTGRWELDGTGASTAKPVILQVRNGRLAAYR